MDQIDQLLEKTGLKYEELTPAEKDTINEWIDLLESTKVGVETVKAHVEDMREAVESELTNQKMNKFSFWSFLFQWKKEYGLRMRLKNYILLEALLTSHAKAKKVIDNQMSGFFKNNTGETKVDNK